MRLWKFIQVVLISTVLLEGCGGKIKGADTQSAIQIRRPAVAGSFYPGTPLQLRQAVEKHLSETPAIKPAGKIVAAVAPHAGYVFSGHVAAYTHKALRPVAFDTIVIIGHDCNIPGSVAFLSDATAFATPLGNVPVDLEMVNALLKYHSGIRVNTAMHAREHTIEVQLPFLQATRDNFKIVPILFGDPTIENCKIMSSAIRAAGQGKRIILLASTDMCHYPEWSNANRIDGRTLEIMPEMNIDKLFAHLQRPVLFKKTPNLSTAMCARGGVGTTLLYALDCGATKTQILKYANSGDVPAGGKDRVVGYCAAVFVE